MRVHPTAPVLALDIDGTLGDYYAHFQEFAEGYLLRELAADWSGTTEFSEALGLDKNTYRTIKLAYRQGGMKRSLPLLDIGYSSAVRRIREELGMQVWICTTRPWQRLDNIDPDTQFWINHHFGRVDGVIYGEEKYQDLIDIVGIERIVGAIDDLPENVTTALSLGLNAALATGDHNLVFAHNRPDIPTMSDARDLFDLARTWGNQLDRRSFV